MSVGVVIASIGNTFLYLNQSNSVLSAVFFSSCTCYAENVYKNGFVTLMCIIYLWFIFKSDFLFYLGFCLSYSPVAVIHNP